MCGLSRAETRGLCESRRWKGRGHRDVELVVPQHPGPVTAPAPKLGTGPHTSQLRKRGLQFLRHSCNSQSLPERNLDK